MKPILQGLEHAAELVLVFLMTMMMTTGACAKKVVTCGASQAEVDHAAAR